MNLSRMLPDLDDVPESLIDDAIFDSFLAWTRQRGITLYPAQEEASLGMLAGSNVILATPTGSGKSMVAIAAHFIALARRQRSFYTAPIKALVSEKFFALCETFGADNVGMMTGDATVNGRAPIICATAEVLANIALRDGAAADVDQVVMDEFHYYSEPDRGWAWQVPLLELPRAQFLLMSATLGDTTGLRTDLSRRTGRETELVAGAQRPVPLDFSYVYTPVHDTVTDLISSARAPIYIVHFSQREATERAQALTSLTLVTKDQKEAIAAEIGSFRFTTAFGRTLSTLLRKGIGVHHAGMLPKYRRLVEKLAQTGLLKVISGTDTLGVGINVPIRTVLMTGLAKYDGIRHRLLTSREFHQIAGRAGRAGYDTEGTVIIEAPEHEIENAKLRRRAGDDAKKKRKLKLKAAPKGEVTWSDTTYDRLIAADPEPLVSRFQVSNSMLLNVIAREGDAFEHMRHLLRDNHESRAQQNRHVLTAIDLYRGLVSAGIVDRLPEPDEAGRTVRLTQQLQRDFALNQPLAPFAVAALDLLDRESDTYTLDVISVIEAVLDDPRPVLAAQQRVARGEEIAALKAEGVDYTDRSALIEEVTWPKPLDELLDGAFDTYAEGHPWVREFELSPKSVVRDMVEHAMTFSDVIGVYGIARSEGVVLRYLTDAWRTLSRTVPAEARTEEYDDIVEWLGELVHQVDSSLVDEWAEMADPDKPVSPDVLARELAFGEEPERPVTGNRRAFRTMVRNLMFRHVELFAWEREQQLADLDAYLEDVPDWPAALDAYFAEYDDLGLGQRARGGDFFRLQEGEGLWSVRQILDDPAGDHGFALIAEVDLAASDEHGEVRLRSLRVETN